MNYEISNVFLKLFTGLLPPHHTQAKPHQQTSKLFYTKSEELRI